MPRHSKIGLYSSPDRSNLSIQIKENDPAMLKIAELDNSVLLWTPFRCHGWADLHEITETSSDSDHHILRKNQSIIISRQEKELFINHLFSLCINKTPYVLGASSNEETDCSGLIMRSVFDCFKVCIPKHSEDQYKNIGIRVKGGNFQSLDLIYGKSRIKGNKHIGFIIIDGGRIKVLEASYWKGRVICGSYGSFCKRFNIVGRRRIFEEKGD